MKKRNFLCCLGSLLLTLAAAAQTNIPPGGNSFVTAKPPGSRARVTNQGWSNWDNPATIYSTFVKPASPGTLTATMEVIAPDNNSVIYASINGPAKLVKLDKGSGTYTLGSWKVDTNYVELKVWGAQKKAATYADVINITVSGSAVNDHLTYVKNNEGNYFHWGRRGPSVHLNYDTKPANDNIEWFYNEITVPVGNDPEGSYFMADGFGEGYFGMQVNGPAERHILFSVWSPYSTDDPKSIPADQQIKMLKKGEGVHTGEFGNEGSGGQSYMNYPWKAGNTYKFLLHGRPVDSTHTEYTAYFFAPEKGQWMLLASFSRPRTHGWLTHLHSFLENFNPDNGYITRQAWYHNQWVKTASGKWVAVTSARFTGDNTARIGYRLDYDGGSGEQGFYLRNCGFFNHPPALNGVYTVTAPTTSPDIDLEKLP